MKDAADRIDAGLDAAHQHAAAVGNGAGSYTWDQTHVCTSIVCRSNQEIATQDAYVAKARYERFQRNRAIADVVDAYKDPSLYQNPDLAYAAGAVEPYAPAGVAFLKFLEDASEASLAIEGAMGPETAGLSFAFVPPTLGVRGLARSGLEIEQQGIVVGRALCSFPAETRVLMADGTTKPIADVQVGDWVMAADQASGSDPEPRRVSHVWKHGDDFTYLHTSAGTITTTADHPFYDEASGTFIGAASLAWGASLRDATGARVVAWGAEDNVGHGIAYNLEVQGRHTYFVQIAASRYRVLVHNTCGDEFADLALKGKVQPPYAQPSRGGGLQGALDDFNALNRGDEVWGYNNWGMPYIRGVDGTGQNLVVRPWSTGGAPTLQRGSADKIRYP